MPQNVEGAIYPNSNKIRCLAGNAQDELVFRRHTAVPWSDGEEGWDKA